mgnify:CR=1 FL=1|tara:strand:+ start:4651 stop:5643 length:993 start_codon:yes stop_codon:yes gene_type:complete
MYLGTKANVNSDPQVLAQLGVAGVGHGLAAVEKPFAEWSPAVIEQLHEHYGKYGVRLEMLWLPLRGRPAFIGNLDKPANDNYAGAIWLGPSDERERALDGICDCIRMAGQGGIRSMNYNISVQGHMRTEPTTGRGGATVATFQYEKLDQSKGDYEGGVADDDALWERVVPVAEEYRVQLACHPQDPGIGLGKTYRGVGRPLGMAEGFKKLIDLYDSPYNGLNFCQGCMGEALENPAEDIFDVIRYFGERKKIFNVHFRNIKGRLNDFVEVFPDEGDIDMIEALRVYRDVGYEYMIMPDHVPGLSGRAPREVGFAYGYGYIHAALQAIQAA